MALTNIFINLVEVRNQQTHCRVRFVEEETSETFKCTTGLKQKNALSPVLFNFAPGKKVIGNARENREIELVIEGNA